MLRSEFPAVELRGARSCHWRQAAGARWSADEASRSRELRGSAASRGRRCGTAPASVVCGPVGLLPSSATLISSAASSHLLTPESTSGLIASENAAVIAAVSLSSPQCSKNSRVWGAFWQAPQWPSSWYRRRTHRGASPQTRSARRRTARLWSRERSMRPRETFSQRSLRMTWTNPTSPMRRGPFARGVADP
jgi:hypothetical protein